MNKLRVGDGPNYAHLDALKHMRALCAGFPETETSCREMCTMYPKLYPEPKSVLVCGPLPVSWRPECLERLPPEDTSEAVTAVFNIVTFDGSESVERVQLREKFLRRQAQYDTWLTKRKAELASKVPSDSELAKFRADTVRALSKAHAITLEYIGAVKAKYN